MYGLANGCRFTKSFPVYLMLCVPPALLKASSELASIVVLGRSPAVPFKITEQNEWPYMPTAMPLCCHLQLQLR